MQKILPGNLPGLGGDGTSTTSAGLLAVPDLHGSKYDEHMFKPLINPPPGMPSRTPGCPCTACRLALCDGKYAALSSG